MSAENTGQNSALLWLGGVAVTIILGWTIKTGLDGVRTTNKSVTVLKPQVEQNTRRIGALEDWTTNWQTNGELPADVRQTKDIEYLKAAQERLLRAIELVEERIRELEVEAAK